MHHTILSKVFSLIDKTGDRCIVLSEENESAYVVMSLNEYERLAIGKSEVASLTEDELLDRINRDIAVWKSQQTEDDAEQEQASFARAENRREQEWEEQAQTAASGGVSEGLWDEDSWDEDEEEEEDPYYFESV